MSVWRRGPLTENPYVRTPFRVARVPREVVARRSVVQLISQTRRMVATDATAHTIRGEPVTPEKLNAAESVLLSPEQRIVEELLVHATEAPPTKRIRELGRQAAEAMAALAPGPLGLTNPKALACWLADLARQYLDTVEPADIRQRSILVKSKCSRSTHLSVLSP